MAAVHTAAFAVPVVRHIVCQVVDHMATVHKGHTLVDREIAAVVVVLVVVAMGASGRGRYT